MIHCIGDSHSSVFSGKDEIQPVWPQRSDDTLPFFRSYRIGPATAFQLENKIPLINNIINSVYNTGDKILFCFGEVDCRAHLKKQMDLQQKSMDHIVKECVDRYFKNVLKYKDKNIMVWGPIASWEPSRKYNGPSFGSCEERNEITGKFNDYLKKLCYKSDIPFLSIFNIMVDPNNITKPLFLDDWEECHMHLSQRSMIYIINEFKKNSLISGEVNIT